jgi:hypothetical protein
VSEHVRRPTGLPTSLESATKLDRARVPNSVEGHWLLRLYPEAAEASGCFQSGSLAKSAAGWEPDTERALTEAGRRARGQVRRYCAAHRLTRLATLTYGPPFCRDPEMLRMHVRSFFRKLRRRTGETPYLWVPELHADRQRFHVHFGVGRFVRRKWLEEAWPHGWIWIHLHGGLPVGSGSLGEARSTARYLAKYVGKAFGAEVRGLHRYEVAQGFQPRVIRLMGRSSTDVLNRACKEMAAEPEKVWLSDQDEAWSGPPALWASWS